MALTPQDFEVLDEENEGIDADDEEYETEPARTWRMDFETGRLRGFIDGEEALRQYIRKAIATARNRYLIYDDDYGSELDDLLGQTLTRDLIETEIPRLIYEAIFYDDRIDDVTDIEITERGNDLLISVTVITSIGNQLTEEVAV